MSRLKVVLTILFLVFLLSGIFIYSKYFKTKEVKKQDNIGFQTTYPLTINSCGNPVTFDRPPERALAFETNMTEMMLALGLEDKLVGYWTSGVPVGEQFKDKVDKIKIISDKTWPPPGMETIVSFNPDFVFGGWEYNFSEESGVNPDKLAAVGIKSYILTESCIAVGVKPSETLDSTYQDILNLGKIFNVEDRAQTIVTQMQTDIASTQSKIKDVQKPLRVMYYGGGSDGPFTAGKYAMVTKMMNMVGAKNILGDVEDDWIPKASWETIIDKDPEYIMIDDTPWESAKDRIHTLESLPQLKGITAIKEKRYIVFPWTYILPGMEMDEGINYFAKALYPDVFK